MKRILMNEVWDGSNAIRSKVYNIYSYDTITTKTFKQYCNTKEGKQLINDTSMMYIEKAKDQLNVSFISAYVKADKLYIEIESDVNNIIECLSFQCNTSLWFNDCTYELDCVG